MFLANWNIDQILQLEGMACTCNGQIPLVHIGGWESYCPLGALCTAVIWGPSARSTLSTTDSGHSTYLMPLQISGIFHKYSTSAHMCPEVEYLWNIATAVVEYSWNIPWNQLIVEYYTWNIPGIFHCSGILGQKMPLHGIFLEYSTTAARMC